jgi:hypothetical protein
MVGMRDIDPVSENGTLDDRDVSRALEGLAGVYLTSDLYARYGDAAREAGRTPAHPIAFGQALKRHGGQRKSRTVQGRQVGAWLV